MPLERWGSLSVADHVDASSLTANVLLYDRLIVPVMTAQPERDERAYWVEHGWDPDLQEQRLALLKDLAVRRPWDVGRRAIFRQRVAELRAEQNDAAIMDGQHLTRMILAQEQVVEKLPGVAGVSVIAAYNSQAALESDFTLAEPRDHVAAQAWLLSRRLALPAATDGEAILRDAVALSRDAEFRQKRAALFAWQETMAQRGYSPEAAVNYVSELTDSYNQAVNDAFGTVRWRVAFMVCGIGLGFAGGFGVLAAASAALTVVEFLLLDRKPAIEAGSAEPAAMFHDVETQLGVKLRK